MQKTAEISGDCRPVDSHRIAMGYKDEKAKLNAYRSIKQKPDEFTRWSE